MLQFIPLRHRTGDANRHARHTSHEFIIFVERGAQFITPSLQEPTVIFVHVRLSGRSWIKIGLNCGLFLHICPGLTCQARDKRTGRVHTTAGGGSRCDCGTEKRWFRQAALSETVLRVSI